MIDAGQLARINQAPDFLAANRCLYELLDQDPSSRKLWFLGKALRADTTKEGHQDLADEIDKFFVQNGCQCMRMVVTSLAPVCRMAIS